MLVRGHLNSENKIMKKKKTLNYQNYGSIIKVQFQNVLEIVILIKQTSFGLLIACIWPVTLNIW